jgi:hypothetical protein
MRFVVCKINEQTNHMSSAALSSAKNKKSGGTPAQSRGPARGRVETPQRSAHQQSLVNLPHPWSVLTQHDKKLTDVVSRNAELARNLSERDRQFEELAGIVTNIQEQHTREISDLKERVALVEAPVDVPDAKGKKKSSKN